MIRINLLPREEMATRRSISIPQISSFAPLALIVVATIGLTVVHIYQGQKISNLENIIAEEEAETRRLAPEIAKIRRLNDQRSELNERLDMITRLDRDRYFRVHLLDELNRSLPEHMWLTRFEDIGGDRYSLEGVTFSNFLVSDFLQNLSRSPYFTGIDLLIAEQGKINDVKVVKFKAQTTAMRHQPSSAFGG